MGTSLTKSWRVPLNTCESLSSGQKFFVPTSQINNIKIINWPKNNLRYVKLQFQSEDCGLPALLVLMERLFHSTSLHRMCYMSRRCHSDSVLLNSWNEAVNRHDNNSSLIFLCWTLTFLSLFEINHLFFLPASSSYEHPSNHLSFVCLVL